MLLQLLKTFASLHVPDADGRIVTSCQEPGSLDTTVFIFDLIGGHAVNPGLMAFIRFVFACVKVEGTYLGLLTAREEPVLMDVEGLNT